MQKGFNVLSKAASIGILSAFFRVHLPCWSFSLCNSFTGSIFVRRDRHLISSPHLPFASSNDVGGTKDSLQTLKMTSYPIPPTDSVDQSRNDTAFSNISSFPSSNELSTKILEVISPNDDKDTMAVLPIQILKDSCHVLRQFVKTPTTNLGSTDDDDNNGIFPNNFEGFDNTNDLRVIMSSYASISAERFCKIAHASDSATNNAGKKSRKRTWEALQNAAEILQDDRFAGNLTSKATIAVESNSLAVCMVFGALSILEHKHCQLGGRNSGSAKAAASALASTVSRNKILNKTGQPIASLVLQCYLDHEFRNENRVFDLSILNRLANSFHLTEDHIKPHIVAAIVRNTIQLIDSGDQREDTIKQSISGGFALACQLRPWSILSPVELIDVATAYDLYHSALEICTSAHKAIKDNEDLLLQGSGGNDADGYEESCSHQYSASRQEENVIRAVEKLIDFAMEGRMYRRADAMATTLYQLGGRSRYVEARYFHACDTIAKVISKRQFPIVDRQIERVDKAIAKVEACNDKDAKQRGGDDEQTGRLETIGKEYPPQTYSNTLLRSPSVEIREYAIQKFEEVGEIAAAQRLASISGIDYVYDEEAALLAAAKRREKYLQYEDILPGEVPSLITEPDQLIAGFHRLLRDESQDSSSYTKHLQKHIGFDAEWDEETHGAALLQLASTETVLLIDILALSSTEEGVSALRQTVGKLLDNPEWTVIGFACRQDLSRLRASPCVQVHQDGEDEGEGEQHWMHTTTSVVDVQSLIGAAEESLRTTGLSRACEHFLGKPLDKSEQCSLWSSRPLTERQRSYAALDAWVCVGIYQKIQSMKNVA